MKKLLTSKVAFAVVILLFLVGTMAQPNEACRVLIKGEEGGWATDKPSVPVFQVLQKGPVPPGAPGYTPGTDTTNTRAFAGHAVAPPRDYSDHIPKSSIPVFQVLQKGPVPPRAPGYTPGTDTTNTRAFAGHAVAPSRGYSDHIPKSSVPVFQVLQKGPVPPRAPGYTPGTDTTNTRAFAGHAVAPSRGYSDHIPKSSVPVFQVLKKGPIQPPGTPGYTPDTDTTNTRAFTGHAVAPPCGYSNHIPKSSVPVFQVLPKGPVPPPGTPGYTPDTDTTNTRAFAGHAVAPPRGYSNHIPKSSVAADRK